MTKSLTQKNTLLKTAATNRTTKVFKRVFFSPTQKEIQIIFFPTLRFFNFFPNAQCVIGQTVLLM
jgi:hypothetical protein